MLPVYITTSWHTGVYLSQSLLQGFQVDSPQSNKPENHTLKLKKSTPSNSWEFSLIGTIYLPRTKQESAEHPATEGFLKLSLIISEEHLYNRFIPLSSRLSAIATHVGGSA